MIAAKQRRTGTAQMGTARSLGTTALLLVAGLCLPSVAAFAAPKAKATHEKTVVQSDGSGERLRANSLGSFTPTVFDSKFSFTAPGKSAATARQQTIENAYNFTPSGRNNRKALTLGVTSRVVAPVTDTSHVAQTTAPPTVAPPPVASSAAPSPHVGGGHPVYYPPQGGRPAVPPPASVSHTAAPPTTPPTTPTTKSSSRPLDDKDPYAP